VNINRHTGCGLVVWDIYATDIQGNLVGEQHAYNIVTDLGRESMILQNFGLGGSSFVYLGAGASSTAAAHTDTHLLYEHTADAQRKTLTNSSGNSLSASDVVADTYTDALGNNYYRKLVMKAIYLVDDPNTGPFQEYGIFSVSTLPSTPDGVSGVMWDRMVADTAITKSGTVQITVNITVWL
jgi:hypothetical protein